MKISPLYKITIAIIFFGFGFFSSLESKTNVNSIATPCGVETECNYTESGCEPTVGCMKTYCLSNDCPDNDTDGAMYCYYCVDKE